jgi:hypothetical protein
MQQNSEKARIYIDSHLLEISANLQHLVEEVERKYGKKVKYEISEEVDERSFGGVEVDGTGIPTIKLSKKGLNEITIAHELMHLVLRKEGYPIIGWILPKGKNTAENLEYLKWVRGKLFDPIIHAVVLNRRLRSIGFDESESLVKEWESVLKEDRLSYVSGPNKGKALTLEYFRMVLEIKDDNIREKVTKYYKKKGWHKEKSLGQILANKIIDIKEMDSKRAVKKFVECLNMLHNGEIEFAVSGYKSKNYGEHVDKIAIIKVEPAITDPKQPNPADA